MAMIPEESRQDFLPKRAGALAGAVAAPVIVPASALGRVATAPSDRVTVGIIGSGSGRYLKPSNIPVSTTS